MPLVRYFLFAGGALLGLLFLADWYFPAEKVVLAQNDIDRTIIRIHSAHKWPEAINIDTRMSVASAVPVAEAAPVTSPVERVRQAYAFEPSLPPKLSEKGHRHAKPARKPSSRETSRHFALYQASDPRNY